MGYSRQVNQGCSFYLGLDNLLWSKACGVVHVEDSVFAWSFKEDSIRSSTQFTSCFWQKLHEPMHTKLNFSSAYHPQTDGQTERTNQILEDMLRSCALKHGRGWDKSLTCAEFSYNNSYQTCLKMAPFKALYGRKCKTPLYWSQTGESPLFGPEIIKEAERQVENNSGKSQNCIISTKELC
jgi:hypothetical protein